MDQGFVLFGHALLDNTGHLVCISSLKKEDHANHKYYCPHCLLEMYPTFGDTQVHHFRHKGKQCQREQYLHSIAEQYFIEEFRECREKELPFILELHKPVQCHHFCLNKKDGICTKKEIITNVDLTKRYIEISREAKVDLDDHFRRPDILLTAENGEQLWIEIWVTHETEVEKRSDGRILEIKISSEEDLKQIKDHKIVQSKGVAVRLYNAVFEYGSPGVTSSNVDIDFCPDKTIGPVSAQSARTYRQRHPQSISYHTPLQKTTELIIPDLNSIEWVDLGLPSGTLWAKNSLMIQLPFCAAKHYFAKNLPSKEQAEELRSCTKLDWKSSPGDLIIIGPNGEKVKLDAKGKYKAYWLNDYENYKKLGQCFQVGSNIPFCINDKDINTSINIHLCKRIEQQKA